MRDNGARADALWAALGVRGTGGRGGGEGIVYKVNEGGRGHGGG